jgi:translocator protein
VTIKRRVSRASIAISIAVAFTVSGVGGSMTDLGPWYQALKMPDWQPPGIVFPIVWTTIFALCVVCAVLTWRDLDEAVDRRNFILLFGVNAILNLMWSFLFFHLHRPDWSLYQVSVFWLSILALVIFTWRHNKFASILLSPYLLWVAIASVLNLEIVLMNGPFG